jgi:hypothetical protein
LPTFDLESIATRLSVWRLANTMPRSRVPIRQLGTSLVDLCHIPTLRCAGTPRWTQFAAIGISFPAPFQLKFDFIEHQVGHALRKPDPKWLGCGKRYA